MPKKANKVVFKNRYLVWFFAVVLIAGIALVCYILISSQNMNSEYVFTNLKSEKTYVDKQSKFYQHYPSGWQLELDDNGSVTFENPIDNSESISVELASANTEATVRHSFEIFKESDFNKDGNSYSIMQAGTPKAGSDIDMAFVKTQDNRVYYISGHSKDFNAFVLNFKPF